MKYRRLIRDGTKVSVLGLGAWPLGGAMGQMDDKTAVTVARRAIDHGINLIDTARVYLESERRLGKALKDGYRDRCFLATKVMGDYTPAAINATLETSLRALDVDYVDLYQVHHPDPNFLFDETMEIMARLREAGKTRYIGVSNYRVDHMQQAWQGAPFHTCQPRYSMFYRPVEYDLIPYCEKTASVFLFTVRSQRDCSPGDTERAINLHKTTSGLNCDGSRERRSHAILLSPTN